MEGERREEKREEEMRRERRKAENEERKGKISDSLGDFRAVCLGSSMGWSEVK